MSYRSLVVHLEGDARAPLRAEVAIRLARAFDGHLLGVAPTGVIDMPIALDAGTAPGGFGANALDLLNAQAQRAVQAFRQACSAAGFTAVEAQVVEDTAAAALVRQAHCADLCLVSQAEPGSDGYRARRATVEQVVLYSARPTLILPYAGAVESIGEQIMVAWDDSREAARAVADALPLLKRARRVRVLSWTEGTGTELAVLRARTADLARWLQFHGVTAEALVETSPIGIGEAMLSRAADLGTDLIVMGAYGHARLSERVLGGATRGLLESMTVPVLMSH